MSSSIFSQTQLGGTGNLMPLREKLNTNFVKRLKQKHRGEKYPPPPTDPFSNFRGNDIEGINPIRN